MGLTQFQYNLEKKLAVTSGVIGGSSIDSGAGGGGYFGFMNGNEWRLSSATLRDPPTIAE